MPTCKQQEQNIPPSSPGSEKSNTGVRDTDLTKDGMRLAGTRHFKSYIEMT
jgi:hypothetical protein